jgi:hypothetical protein
MERQGRAVRLDEETAGQELVQYSIHHPAAWKELARFMGYQLDGTEEDTRNLGKLIPMFAFQPEENR